MSGTFEPTFFQFDTEYPDSGVRIQFGNSYTFAAPPDAPDQRIFKIMLQGMQYFLDVDGEIDRTVKPERNMAKFEDFYLLNKLWDSWTFPHPVYGDVQVKFHKPLMIPKGIKKGGGVLPDFEIQLVEQP